METNDGRYVKAKDKVLKRLGRVCGSHLINFHGQNRLVRNIRRAIRKDTVLGHEFVEIVGLHQEPDKGKLAWEAHNQEVPQYEFD